MREKTSQQTGSIVTELIVLNRSANQLMKLYCLPKSNLMVA
uniref:Uncharacterized protein n=1 Tax=Anguilla anguilla TaxID=7936 RepID=A0A0E9UHA6_ANGAN